VPVRDKSEHHDGTFSRTDFIFDAENNRYVCLPVSTSDRLNAAKRKRHSAIEPD
jgi:hypothetical protein